MRRKEMEELLKERSERVMLLEQRMAEKEQIISEYRSRERAIVDALSNAQAQAARCTKEAESRAAETIAAAKANGEKILADAGTQAEELLLSARQQSEQLRLDAENAVAGYEKLIAQYNTSIAAHAQKARAAAEQYAVLISQCGVDPDAPEPMDRAEAAPEPAPKPGPEPEPVPQPEPEPVPQPEPEPAPEPEPELEPEPAPLPKQEPGFTPDAAPAPEKDVPPAGEPEGQARPEDDLFSGALFQSEPFPPEPEAEDAGEERTLRESTESDGLEDPDTPAKLMHNIYTIQNRDLPVGVLRTASSKSAVEKDEGEADMLEVLQGVGAEIAGEFFPQAGPEREAEPAIPTVSGVVPGETQDDELSLDALLDEIIRSGE